MTITPKELINLSEDINRISINSMLKINSIIEYELKLVAEKYNIASDKLILISHSVKGNEIIKYEIAIKIHGFIIENTFVINAETLEQVL